MQHSIAGPAVLRPRRKGHTNARLRNRAKIRRGIRNNTRNDFNIIRYYYVLRMLRLLLLLLLLHYYLLPIPLIYYLLRVLIVTVQRSNNE